MTWKFGRVTGHVAKSQLELPLLIAQKLELFQNKTLRSSDFWVCSFDMIWFVKGKDQAGYEIKIIMHKKHLIALHNIS